MNRIADVLRRAVAALDWLPSLVSRFVLAGIFIPTGWGKLRNLDKVAEFFASLNIPAPHIQAPLVASVEFGCGVLLLLGLFTRLAAVPLIGTMAVAIVTAKLGDVAELSDFLSLSEFLFIVLLLWLVVKGAGAVSADFLLARRGGSEAGRSSPAGR